MSILNGYKTYLTGLAMITYAGTGWFLGDMQQPQALNWIFEAVMLMTIRHGIARKS